MTPEDRAYRLYRKAALYGYLVLLARCIEFYGSARILGLIPPPQDVTVP